MLNYIKFYTIFNLPNCFSTVSFDSIGKLLSILLKQRFDAKLEKVVYFSF